MDLSIVIPARNEAENIAPLVGEIAAALDGKLTYEVIYIDDGSSDETAATVRAVAATHPAVRLLRHASSCGAVPAMLASLRSRSSSPPAISAA